MRLQTIAVIDTGSFSGAGGRGGYPQSHRWGVRPELETCTYGFLFRNRFSGLQICQCGLEDTRCQARVKNIRYDKIYTLFQAKTT